MTPFPSLTIVLLDRLFGPRVQRHKGALIVTRSAGGRRECPYGPRQPPGPRPVRSQNRRRNAKGKNAHARGIDGSDRRGTTDRGPIARFAY